MRLRKSTASKAVCWSLCSAVSLVGMISTPVVRAQDTGQRKASRGIQSAKTIVKKSDTVPSKQTETARVTEVAIPFQTIRRETDLLYVGQRHVLTYGVEGVLQRTTTTILADGHKVKQSTTEQVLRKPVDEVILVGQKARPKPLSTTLSSRSVDGFNVLKELTVVATAYVGGGRTAMGSVAQSGVIAVDPSVIPLGTRVYIPGFGVTEAADTGGAIRGDRIDICMSSEWQAEKWGVRTIQIYEIQ